MTSDAFDKALLRRAMKGDYLGQRVQKAEGYPFPGIVVADFVTLEGQRRVVVQCTAPAVYGCLHVFNLSQLVVSDAATGGSDEAGEAGAGEA